MINTIRLGKRYEGKEAMLNSLSNSWLSENSLNRIPMQMLQEAKKITLSEIDSKLRTRTGLGVVEALSGMLHVVAGTNLKLSTLLFPSESVEINKVKGTFFLTRMAAKEQYVGLTPEEVAGIAMGGMIDLVYLPKEAELTETSGMGADRGWHEKKVKTINASTLSALVLASMGFKSMKHGSYGNTTKIGSTDVPEHFGANINQNNPKDIERILNVCNFWFNDAHAVKTIHYLSHLLMVETINHVVGPMTPPIGRGTTLFKLMGVNHYMHPETVAKAYTLLHELGVVKLGGAVVLAGVRRPPSIGQALTNRSWYYENAYLDEASPNLTLISCAEGGNFLGTQLVNAKRTFGTKLTDDDIKVNNQANALMKADQLALMGREPFAQYLALNAAFALATHYLGSKNLKDTLLKQFEKALSSIQQGCAFKTLLSYVKETGGEFRSWV